MSRLSKKVAEKYSLGAYCKINDYGVSYTAIDRQGKEYFVKQIGSSIRKGRVRPLIRREIFLLKALRNYTNIITLHEIIHDDPPSEELTMIFEVAGIPLNLLIHFLGQLDEHILFVLYQLLDGLRYIHSAGIIHSELRLQFVLMNQDDKISISHLRHAISPNKKQRIHDQCSPLIQDETWYKAPEWWLNPNKLSPAIDMWAFGCILAELYLQRPLFKIETNEDQLKKIFETIGAPKGEDLLCYDLDYSLEEKINSMNIEKCGSLRDLFGNRPLVLDLLEKLLEFNPSKRLTAKEALNRRLFTQFHIPEDNERFDFGKYSVEGSDWSQASLIGIFEESQKKEIEMIILAHNIIRSRNALALFPIEIWKLIFQFIELPSIGSCSQLVDPIFSALKNELLPREIKKIIAADLDNKSQLKIRAVNKEWLSMIDIKENTYYGITKSELAQLVSQLKHIQKPFSLTLRQNVVNDIKYIASELTQLQNLTELNIEAICDRTMDPNDWQRLTELTNLRRVNIPSIPPTLLLKFPNLEVFEPQVNVMNSHKFNQLCTLTQLQRIEITMEPYIFAEASGFGGLKKLTSVDFKFQATPENYNQDVVPNLCKYLTGVKDLTLEYSSAWYGNYLPNIDSLSLGDLALLESLSLNQILCDSLNSTNLTYLMTDSSRSVQLIAESASSLVNLKSLNLIVADNDLDSSFMTVLTALEELTMNRWASDEEDILRHINSSRLTSLLLATLGSKCKFSHLYSLEKLNLNWRNFESQHLHQLQKLTYLSIVHQNEAQVDVSSLPNLEVLELNSYSKDLKSVILTPSLKVFCFSDKMATSSKIDMTNLPNLEILRITVPYEENQFVGLSSLTTLTKLEFHPLDISNGNFNILTNFTNLLEVFIPLPGPILPYLVNATNLQSLDININSPKELELLPLYSKLSRLVVFSSTYLPADAILDSAITRLTSLKVLRGGPFDVAVTVDKLKPYLPKLWNYCQVTLPSNDKTDLE